MDAPSRPPTLAVEVNERDHIQGAAHPAVTVVEYADYQCPYCGDAYLAVKRMQEEIGNTVRFVFRNFPLVDSHPHALAAAEAAEAAGVQSKFWEMHDLLFEHQQALDEQHLMEYAQQLGLDMEQFQRDLAGHRAVPEIERDLDGGGQSGVEGTPTFYINGLRYEGPFDGDSLVTAVEDSMSSY